METFEHIEIGDLLPQQKPFVLVDRLDYIDDVKIITRFRVENTHILVDNGKLSAAGIVENIAQTAAARMGYINKYIEKGAIRLGFIGEIKNLDIVKYPAVGAELITSVYIQNEILSTLLVKTETRVDDEIIASGQMKIFMSDIVQNLS